MFSAGRLLVVVLSVCLLNLAVSSATGQEAGDSVDFVTAVKPIFEQHCLSCHGEKDPEGFRIDIKDEAMDYIDAGSSEDSPMYQVLVSDDEGELMPPPEEEDPLSQAQIEAVRIWIEQGAEWPDDVEFVLPVKSPADQDPTEDGENDLGVDDPNADQPAVQPEADDRIYEAIGSLHAAAVHLPVGLLLAAGLFSLLSLRGNFVMSDCAYYCLWLGTLGAIVACVSGWWANPSKMAVITDFGQIFDSGLKGYMHRISGLIATVCALLLALLAMKARHRDPDDGMLWKLGLILLACGIGFVGHEGGELTHTSRHYKALNSLAAEVFPGLFGEDNNEAPAKEESKPEKQEADPNENEAPQADQEA